MWLVPTQASPRPTGKLRLHIFFIFAQANAIRTTGSLGTGANAGTLGFNRRARSLLSTERFGKTVCPKLPTFGRRCDSDVVLQNKSRSENADDRDAAC
jgi:hypothetical protein